MAPAIASRIMLSWFAFLYSFPLATLVIYLAMVAFLRIAKSLTSDEPSACGSLGDWIM